MLLIFNLVYILCFACRRRIVVFRRDMVYGRNVEKDMIVLHPPDIGACSDKGWGSETSLCRSLLNNLFVHEGCVFVGLPLLSMRSFVLCTIACNGIASSYSKIDQ
jgi:hypothetical protein